MDKFVIRLSVILVALYFLVSALWAILFKEDILGENYVLLFELGIILSVYNEKSKYYCQYLKYTALSIFIADFISRLDNKLNFLSADAHNFIFIGIVIVGILVGVVKALHHYYLVRKLKRKIKRHEQGHI